MPTFELTSPDGKTYEINAPEGATSAQAFQYLKQSKPDLFAAKSGPSVTAPSAPAAGEGMPAARGPTSLDKAWMGAMGGRNPSEILADVREKTSPSAFLGTAAENYLPNVASAAQASSDWAQAGGQSAIENLKAGRPASALLGAGQQLLGGAGIVASPFTGLYNTLITDPVSRMFGPETGERAGIVANTLIAPETLAASVRPVVTAANLGARGVNQAEKIFNPKLNTLAEAVGAQGPEIANALRASKSGVEGAGQAAAPLQNVRFSQTAKALEQHAEQTVADAAATQDAVLKARANIAEGKAAEGSRTLADAVAAPDKQDVGQKLTDIAYAEKKTVRNDVINPAAENVENLSGEIKTDISKYKAKAQNVVDSVGVDAATPLARQISKLENNQATLKEIGDMRSAINREAAKAKASGDAMGYKDLMDLHKELNDAVMTSKTLPKEAVTAYGDFLKLYADAYAKRFKTGLQFDLFRGKNGVNQILPENVVNKFMNTPTNTDQFIALYGANPEALQNAKVGIEGMFRDKAIKDGVIDTAEANKFLDKYSAQIDKLDAKGLGIRDKLNTLITETDRTTAPAANIAEVRGAVKGAPAPAGPAATATQQRVAELSQAASPEDLTALRDAVEVARRRGKYEELANVPTKNKLNVPEPIETPSLLSLTYRIPLAVIKRVSKELTQKSSRELGAMLSDPSRLNEVADLIDKALAMKAKQSRRVLPGVTAPASARTISVLNALAPPNQNSLAGQ
jgi:hypothetical protein